MFCNKCGKELKDNWVRCPYCSNAIENNPESQISLKSNGKEKLVLFVFFVFVALSFIKELSGIVYIGALITIVTGYIKFPNSRTIKVFFWIFISITILIMLYTLFIIFSCLNIIPS